MAHTETAESATNDVSQSATAPGVPVLIEATTPAESSLTAKRKLEIAHIQQVQALRDLDRAVAVARQAGLSWQEIADSTELSMQAAHQRWSASGRSNHRKAQAAHRQRNRKVEP